jgi:protease I
MGSHTLTTEYDPVPEALRARLVGEDYILPDFGAANTESLKGYRVALVTTHGPELPEFHVPLTYLRDRGASVDVVTQDWLFDWQPEAPGIVVLAQWLAVNVCVKADKKVSDAKIEDYDAVIIIGGAWNPIMLRTDEAMKNFIRDAQGRRLLIAAICHGPQLLISTKAFPSGTQATSVNDVRIDMANAGFRLLDGPDNWEDYDKAHPVVYDEHQRLITSPSPKALKEFCEQIGKKLRKDSAIRLA